MNSVRNAVALVVAAVAVIVVLWWAVARMTHETPALRPETRAEIDSLNLTKPAHDSARHANTAAELVHMATADRQLARSREDQRRADSLARERDSLGTVADSLARLARSADSSKSVWRSAYDAEHVARIASDSVSASLQRSADSARQAAQEQAIARDSADRRSAADSARDTKAETAMNDAATDAEHAGRCRILYVVPCLSRTKSAVVGAVIGGVLVETVRLVVESAKKH